MASRAVGPEGCVIAFEPAERAFRYLEQTIAHNKLTNVTAEKKAVAKSPGIVEFFELPFDPWGLSWRPEASSMARDNMDRNAAQSYSVEAVALDSFLDGCRPDVIKMDIEGFEVDAFEGAKRTLENCRPILCVSIHKKPSGDGTTDDDLIPVLKQLDYDITRMGKGNVLIAKPSL